MRPSEPRGRIAEVGGAFGVAIVCACFAATGDYGTPSSFTDGYVAAMTVAAVLALIGAAAASALPRPVESGRSRVAVARIPAARR